MVQTSFLLVTALLAAGVTGFEPEPDDGPRVTATLFAEHAVVQPGQTTWLAIRFEVQEGWHIYWPGQNETGMSPILDWKLPEGWEIGRARWPAPSRHVSAGDMLDHVLEGSATVLFPVRVPKDATPGSGAMLFCAAEWLVCKQMCIAERDDLMYSLKVAGQFQPLPVARSRDLAEIAHARSLLPEPMPESGDPVSAALNEDGSLMIHAAPGVRLTFAPYEDSRAALDLLTSGTSETGELRVSFDPADERPIAGVITIEGNTGKARSFEYRHPPASSQELDGFTIQGNDPRPEEESP